MPVFKDTVPQLCHNHFLNPLLFQFHLIHKSTSILYIKAATDKVMFVRMLLHFTLKSERDMAFSPDYMLKVKLCPILLYVSLIMYSVGSFSSHFAIQEAPHILYCE